MSGKSRRLQHKDREALPLTGRAFVLQKQEKQSTLVILLLNILTSLCINSFHIFCDFHLKNRHQGQPNDNQPLCSIQQGQLERALQCGDKQNTRHQDCRCNKRKYQPGIDSFCPHPDRLRIGTLVKSAKHLREGQHTERHCLTAVSYTHLKAPMVVGARQTSRATRVVTEVGLSIPACFAENME